MKELKTYNISIVILGGSMLFFVLLLAMYGSDEDGLRQQIRWSARISFFLFCMAFSVGDFHYFFKNNLSRWLLLNRKLIGISFAFIHLIHLVFLVILQYVYHPVFELAATSSIIGGGIAYFFVIIMLLTSFENGKDLLTSGQWTFLHTIGGYWIWMIFMATYFKRTETEPIFWIFVGILVLVFVLRALRLVMPSNAQRGL